MDDFRIFGTKINTFQLDFSMNFFEVPSVGVSFSSIGFKIVFFVHFQKFVVYLVVLSFFFFKDLFIVFERQSYGGGCWAERENFLSAMARTVPDWRKERPLGLPCEFRGSSSCFPK